MAAAIPVILAVISTAATVYSVVSSSQASEKAEHKQERMARSQAEQARLASEQRAKDYERRAKAALAEEHSRRGGSGVTGEGSPLLTYYENAKVFEEDVARIRAGGAVEERGLIQQAELHGDYAKAEREAGYVKAGQSLLTGATSVFNTANKVGWV